MRRAPGMRRPCRAAPWRGLGFALLLALAPLPARATDCPALPLPAIAEGFDTARPDAVVNCAAWIALDAAEDNDAAAFGANALEPALVAAQCAARGIPLIKVSTDYVYDGRKGSPYLETDAPNPRGAYGRTKREGEWTAFAGNPHMLVLGAAGALSPVGSNVLRIMLRVGAERSELRVVADENGSATAALDLADAITAVLGLIRDDGWQDAYRGVFHATGTGYTTWDGFAETIFAQTGGPHPVVHAITTADDRTMAVRPADGRLDGSKLRGTFGVSLPLWKQNLTRVIHALHAA
jgi:dTDP-4-dehydrorhamnose reductase